MKIFLTLNVGGNIHAAASAANAWPDLSDYLLQIAPISDGNGAILVYAVPPSLEDVARRALGLSPRGHR